MHMNVACNVTSSSTFFLLRCLGLSISTPISSLRGSPGRVLVDAIEEPAHVLWLDTGGDSMPEVRDPSTFTCQFPPRRKTLDFSFDPFASAVENDGVEIALERHVVSDNLADFDRVQRPVQAQCRVPRLLWVAEQGKCAGGMNTFGEEGHGYGSVAEFIKCVSDLVRNV